MLKVFNLSDLAPAFVGIWVRVFGEAPSYLLPHSCKKKESIRDLGGQNKVSCMKLPSWALTSLSWSQRFFLKSFFLRERDSEQRSSEAATTSREAKKNFKPLGPGQPRSQILSPVIYFPYFCSKEDFINDTNMVAKSELLGVVPARPNFLERMVKSIACDNRTLLASDVLSICVTHRTYTDCLAHLWHIKHCLMGYQNCAKCQVCTG